MLNKFSCIALAGVATEYLLYGYAEGGLDDINKVFRHQFTYVLSLQTSYNSTPYLSVMLSINSWMDCSRAWVSPRTKLIHR
jgi:hypothetical protein